MSPVKTPPNPGTSPSPVINKSAQGSWGSQEGTTSAQDALKGAFYKNPVTPDQYKKGGDGKSK